MIDWPGLLFPIWLVFLCPPKKENSDIELDKKNIKKEYKIKNVKKKIIHTKEESNYVVTPCEIINGECIKHKHNK